MVKWCEIQNGLLFFYSLRSVFSYAVDFMRWFERFRLGALNGMNEFQNHKKKNAEKICFYFYR